MKTRILILAAVAALGMSLDALAADAKAGAAKAGPCAGCHGQNGISSNPLWPNLAGQPAAYLAKTMRDYRSGQRDDPMMSSIAERLTDAEIEDLAAYYASLPPGG